MKKVLDVGNCDPDHASITKFVTQHFDAQVDRAKLPADTMEKLRSEPYDLVLINRKLDEDYSDGIEILKLIKSDPGTKEIPVMLVTNFAEHQEAAVAQGAIYGFGKLEYDMPETVERVGAVLG